MFIKFEGDEVEIVIDRDHGYEPDTNAHEIDWHFVKEHLNRIWLTEEQHQSIYTQIIERGEDGERR